jgi:hypothetical protein
MSHIHTTDSDSGVATGMILGIVIALLVAVVVGFFVFSGYGLRGGDTTTDGGTSGTGGGTAPTSMQYLVPDHQVSVR